MILLKNKIINKKNILIFIVFLLPIIFQYMKFNKAVFAETTRTVVLKVSLFFNADLDNSKRVDGKDLALLMFFFGKEEKDYKSNIFKVNPDLTGDKIVDGEDLTILASHFGLSK